MFNKVPFRLGSQTLLQIFPNRQTGLGQKAIYKELQQIKQFRNRIAHHEPICFDATGRKSMVYVQTNYALILKYISFLGYNKNELFFGLDVMPDIVMNKITKLKSYSPLFALCRFGCVSSVSFDVSSEASEIGDSETVCGDRKSVV